MDAKVSTLTKEIRGDDVFELVNLTARLGNKAARMRLGSMGAWPGQIPIVLCLLAEEGLSQKQLIERTRIEQSTMAEHLDRMERDDLIFRVRDKNDRRVYRIFLGDQLKKSSDWLVNELEAGGRLYTSGVSGEELEQCAATLAKIVANLEKYTAG
jgi:DNA-binding MarR family transcriptional regulator